MDLITVTKDRSNFESRAVKARSEEPSGLLVSNTLYASGR